MKLSPSSSRGLGNALEYAESTPVYEAATMFRSRSLKRDMKISY